MTKLIHPPFQQRKLQRGFTLIEILVVILLIGIIVGGGIAAFRRLANVNLVGGAGRRAEQANRSAQKNALAGVKPSGWCSDPNTLDSYSIGMNRPGWGPGVDQEREFEIRADCSDGTDLAVESGSLPEGTRYRWNRRITFSVLDGTATFLPGQGIQQTCLSDYPSCISSGNIVYEIRTTEGGSISFERL